uniref:Nidogen 2 like 1 n=1 Tax=Rattus norvegicus TaxID=10116 RepID=A0ABK0LE64_RAT
MSWDLTARRHHRLSLLLVLVLLSRAGALRPVELFPYGELWGDRLPQEGDVGSSPAVKLAVPLCFYSDQFSNLYVSSAPRGGHQWHHLHPGLTQGDLICH